MKDIMLASVSALCIGTLICAVSVANHVNETLQSFQSVPNILDQTRIDAFKEFESAESDLMLQLARTSKDLDNHLTVAEFSINDQLFKDGQIIDNRLKEATQTTGSKISDLQTTLNRVVSDYETQVSDFQTAVAPLWAKINEQEPMVYSRFLAVSGEGMRTMDSFRRMSESADKVFPSVAKNVDVATGNVALITSDVHEYTKPRGFIRGTLLPLMISGARLIF